MVNFKTLWDNYPNGDEIKTKCLNKQRDEIKPFDDYCAIRMSECFTKSGIDMSKCPSSYKCWSHSEPKHVLLAENLAKWLSLSPLQGFGQIEKIEPATFQKILSGKTGVVFFKDYWKRKGESEDGRSGDHIDLWSKNRITEGSMTYRAVIEFFGFVSDLNKSREIWFWEIK